MKIKHQQLILLIVAFIITGVSIIFLGSSAVIGAMAGAFLAAASAYTALDLMAIVKMTEGMPQGEFERADLWKYIFAVIMMAILFIITVIKQQISDLDLELAIGLFGPGIVCIIAIMITGVKSNKIATAKNGDL